MNIFKTTSRPIVNISRIIYLVISIILGITLAYNGSLEEAPITWTNGASLGFFIGCLVICLESWLKGYSLSAFTHATFGLLTGLLCWLLISLTLKSANFTEILARAIPDYGKFLADSFYLICMTAFGFIGTVLALRSGKDDFAIIIPYVRFQEDSLTAQPIVVDMTTLIDGRLSNLIQSGFINGRIIIPKLILEELQIMNNSPSGSNRSRGERGLANLERLQAHPNQEVSIYDPPSTQYTDTIESIIINTAKDSKARIITLDESLSKIAELRGIPFLNISALDRALRTQVTTGSKVDVHLNKPGKDSHQAVGQLPDGPIIVVNQAAEYIGTTQTVIIISTLNTTAGLMAFAELEQNYNKKALFPHPSILLYLLATELG